MAQTLEEFSASLQKNTPPAGLTEPLQALWHDAKGDWHLAHELVQHENEGDGAWVHAYLHRKEGDLSNALYWYKQAGRRRPRTSLSLDEEWHSIAEALLERQ